MASFHNWTGDEEIDKQVPQFLNEDNAATQEKLNTKFNKSYHLAKASDLNNIRGEGFYICGSNNDAKTMLNCPTEYAFGLMVWGTGEIVYQEVREYNRSSKNQDYNNCWRRSYYSSGNVQNTWSNWQQVAYTATTLAGYGITDGMRKDDTNIVGAMDIIKKDVDTSAVCLMGGASYNTGASIKLFGGECAPNYGGFVLKAADSKDSIQLFSNPSGMLRWGNKNIVRSVNNALADDNGNVNIATSSVTVDSALSSTSTNPVQNKAIYTALQGKVNTSIFNSGFAFSNPDATIIWVQNSHVVGAINPSSYSGTANAATHDGEGNVIAETYAKRNTANTWTAPQDFQQVKVVYENYYSVLVSGTSHTPKSSVMYYNATGAFTLDLSVIVSNLSPSASTVFTAFFKSTGDYTLTIKGAGAIKYTGSASDVAFTNTGLLLNILIGKDADANVTSIVQASKLS